MRNYVASIAQEIVNEMIGEIFLRLINIASTDRQSSYDERCNILTTVGTNLELYNCKCMKISVRD